MINIAVPGDAGTDWPAWVTPLTQFSQATGLTVSVSDVRGWRQVGPLLSGTALERDIAAAVVANDQVAQHDFHGLRVCSLPLTQHGEIYGVVVYGWRFRDFSSPTACDPRHLLPEGARREAFAILSLLCSTNSSTCATRHCVAS